MRNLLHFLLRYHFFLLFVLIEGFSLFLAIQNNNYQKAAFVNSANYVSGSLNEVFHDLSEYFSLKGENERLAKENMELRLHLKSNYLSNRAISKTINDSLYQQQYTYIVAKVINNSTNRPTNVISLNKGSRHGVRSEMAVIAPDGVVGIVRDVSQNFCTVIPVLNINLKISAKIKRNQYFGTFSWSGVDYKMGQLDDIPFHVDLQKGDSVITSGYSAIFPEGMLIGTIEDFSVDEGKNFYDIRVLLSTDFKKLNYVYIVGNLLKNEQVVLEKQFKHDQAVN